MRVRICQLRWTRAKDAALQKAWGRAWPELIQDAAADNTLQKIFRRQQASQRDWYKVIETLTRLRPHNPPPRLKSTSHSGSD